MEADRQWMLTTIDNPYDPFTQWDDWLRYDRDQGYYTNEYLARVANTDENNSDEENKAILRAAMKDIVTYNPTEMWIITYEPKENKEKSKK